jgi:hypothetical protein
VTKRLHKELIRKDGRIYILGRNQSQFDTYRREIFDIFPEFMKDQKNILEKFKFLEDSSRGVKELRGAREPVIINCLALGDMIYPELKYMMDREAKSHDYLIKDLTDMLEGMKDSKLVSEVMNDVFKDNSGEFQKLLGDL